MTEFDFDRHFDNVQNAQKKMMRRFWWMLPIMILWAAGILAFMAWLVKWVIS